CRGFNSYYGLYSSFIYTLYFKPIIEYKKLSQGEVSERSNEFVEDIYYNILNRNFEDIEEYDITDDDTINEVSTTIDSKNNIDDPDENIG
ncbi:MAG: hypothetical protein RR789_01495, partial [Clostridium sp.]